MCLILLISFFRVAFFVFYKYICQRCLFFFYFFCGPIKFKWGEVLPFQNMPPGLMAAWFKHKSCKWRRILTNSTNFHCVKDVSNKEGELSRFVEVRMWASAKVAHFLNIKLPIHPYSYALLIYKVKARFWKLEFYCKNGKL